MKRHYAIASLGALALAPLFAGCATTGATSTPPAPTPTIAAMFRTAAPSTPTTQPATTTPQPATTPAPRATDRINEVAVFADKLEPGWTPKNSWGVRYDLAAKKYAHGGASAVEITPTEDFGAFFLALQPDSSHQYRRDDVVGVSFWLNGGDGTIETDNLAVAVLGSNKYTYWVSGDTSVDTTPVPGSGGSTFSETRLYYLDIRRAIPPDTWVEVVVWLDDRIYDPTYTYVTGMYIKNDAGFQQPYYIDDVSLLIGKT